MHTGKSLTLTAANMNSNITYVLTLMFLRWGLILAVPCCKSKVLHAQKDLMHAELNT